MKPADKGSATVIMDRDAYIAEADKQLNNIRRAASSACTGVLLGLHICDTAVQADEWLKLMFYFSSTVTPPGEQPSFAHHLLHCPGSIFDMPTAYHHFLSIIGVSKDRIVHLCKPVQSIISLGY